MAIFEGFRATNIWNAFILNSIVAALVILIAMLAKDHFDSWKDDKGNAITRTTSTKSIALTLIITFTASFLSFTAMHFMFDYGRGQLIDQVYRQ
jgi:hypothetical protein